MPSVPKPKRHRTKHFFAEWREYRGLTQERAVERLGAGWSQSKLSRIESSRTPFSEDDLFAAAKAYNCTPADLLTVNPLKEGEVIDLMRLMHEATPDAQRAAIAVLKSLKS